MSINLNTSASLVAAALLLAACATTPTTAYAAPQSSSSSADVAKSDPDAAAPAEMTEATPAITGRNVNAVVFGGGGRLAKSGESQWTEYDMKTGQPAFVFTETHRDDWSVYLQQVDDPKRLQIDIHRMMIGYTSGTEEMRDLYTIASASLTPPAVLSKYVHEGVNGPNLAWVSFGDKDAGFVLTGDKVWTEYNEAGEVFTTFTETHRDEWSVYLNDASRNIRIQLDVHRDMILLGQNGGAMMDQWPMTGAAKLRDNLTDAAG